MSWPWELPNRMNGIAVIFDVNAATTNICLFLFKGVKRLLVSNDSNIKFLKKKYSDALVIGQSKKFAENFFNYSNRTYEISDIKFKDKDVLYMTNNGTRIIEAVIQKGAKYVVCCSFTNINRLHRWVRDQNGQDIYLIPAGEIDFKDKKALDDEICASVFKDLLMGNKIEWQKVLNLAWSFIKKNYSDYAVKNPNLLLKVDSYPVLPICKESTKGVVEIKKLDFVND